MKYLCAISAVLLSLAIFAPAAQAQAPYGYGQPQGYHGVLSPDDQQQYDKYYTKWVDASRKGDQDDVTGNARHMQDIMARYNIPPNVPFDAVASGGNSAYPQNGVPAYGTAGRLSPDEQKDFDKAYSKWLDDQRRNDQDDVAGDVRKMQEIMARNNIAPNTPFAAIASNGYNAAAPNTAYGYGAPQRLSADDQKSFDKAYRDWSKARHKKDMDDVDKNARKMQKIMARYNIPANVPFDRIASGYAYH